LLRDLVFAVRTLLGRPAFTSAVATLAVGIGATTAIFSTVNAALLRPLPFPDPEALYDLGTGLSDGRFSTGLVAPSEMFALSESAPSVVKAALVRRGDTTLAGEEATGQSLEPVQVIVHSVSEGFFELFGLPMTLGTGFSPEHHVPVVFKPPAPGQPPPTPPAFVAVLSHAVWQNQFGRDPQIVAKYAQLAYGRALIVGVAHHDFDVPGGTGVWTNLIVPRDSVAHSYEGYMRVRPGTSPKRLDRGAGAGNRRDARRTVSRIRRRSPAALSRCVRAAAAAIGPIRSPRARLRARGAGGDHTPHRTGAGAAAGADRHPDAAQR
jgi:putative ABC transport system permease protein